MWTDLGAEVKFFRSASVLLAVGLIMAACQGAGVPAVPLSPPPAAQVPPTPTPDIPATVQAAIKAALPTPSPTPTPNIAATVTAALQATVQAIPTATPPPSPTPTLLPTPIPSATPTPISPPSDRREGLLPLHSFVASPNDVPAADIRQIVLVQSKIDRIFKERFGIPYYGGMPELSRLYEPHDVRQLEAALKDIKSLTEWKYVLNVFDCSNMAALTQFYLANAGFRTVMVVGRDLNNFSGHAWVVVLISDPTPQAIPIEATTRGGPAIPKEGSSWSYTARGVTGTQSYDDYVTQGWAIQDIYQAAASIGRDEFTWWDGRIKVDSSLLHRAPDTPKLQTPTPTTTKPAASPTPTPPPNIMVNPPSAPAGEVFRINGQGFTPNTTIPTLGIVIGGLVGNTAPIPIKGDGSFSYSFALRSDFPIDTFIIDVRDLTGRYARGSLTVTRAVAPPAPTLTVSPASIQPGNRILITGLNFTPYGTILSANVVFGGNPSVGPTFTVDGTGRFAMSLTISPQRSAGTYTIVVTDSAGKKATANITVTVPTSIAVSPASASLGATYTLTGSGFTPSGTIPAGGITIGGVRWNTVAISVDAAGRFAYTFRFRAGTAQGTYTIVVTDSVGRTATTNVTVTIPATVPPSGFYGEVRLNGLSVPIGTKIGVYIGGVKVTETSTLAYQGKSVYNVDVLGSTLYEGQPIRFSIGNIMASQVGAWRSGINVALDLTVP